VEELGFQCGATEGFIALGEARVVPLLACDGSDAAAM
jgi:hypothetical protein